MPPLSKKQRDNYIEGIHQLLLAENPRLPYRHIARNLGIYSKTASKIYKEATEEGILFPPMLRPRIRTDYTEYVYSVNGKNIQNLFEKLSRDSRVEYVTWCRGQFDLLLITNERIDLTVEREFEEVVLSGERTGDYIFSFVERGDYHAIFSEIDSFLDIGRFRTGKLTIKPEKRGNEWSDREQKLFRYLKNDVRKTFTGIQKELDISRSLLLKCYSIVRKHTIVAVPYYPKRFDMYTIVYLIIETEHEKQIVEVLSKFPCQSSFFKVRDSLICMIGTENNFTRRLFTLLNKMVTSTFVEDLSYSIPLYYFSQD